MCKRILLQNGERKIVKAGVALALCSLILAVTCACVVAARYPLFYAEALRREAAKSSLDPVLVAAVVSVESGFDADAVSSKGAVGLMQLLPSTARYCERLLGVEQADLRNPEHNLRLGCGYLRYLLDRFGSERYALMAYNAGEGRVREWLSAGRTDIPYPETERYLRKIAAAKRAYKGRV